MKRDVTISVLLAAATLAVYGPVGGHGFVAFDDMAYFSDNPPVRQGLTWEGVGWAFTTGHVANWHPVTWLSHMVDCQLFGLNAGAHHLVNVLLHIANSVLLYGVLKRMTSAVWPSALVAALFAWHPLHVESVAWASERKDVLSTFFWILTMAAYGRYTRRPGWRTYVWVLLWFALGLMAKPMLVTLPFVLLLLDYWPLGRLTWAGGAADGRRWGGLLAEKIPLFVLSLASSVVTLAVQSHGGAVKSVVWFPWGVRVANALVAYAVYLAKTLWPAHLAAFYPYQPIATWQWVLALAVLGAISLVAICLAARRPYLIVGWLWFLGTLVPVIGLIQVGTQALADRYTYVPLIGVFVMVAWAGGDLAAGGRGRRLVVSVVAGAALAGCLVVTWFQVGYWQDTVSLFERAVRVTHDNARAHRILAKALHDQGQLERAIAHYREALRIEPDEAKAYTNLGRALRKQGQLDAAIAQFRKALRLEPDDAVTHAHIGVALHQQGAWGEAIEHLQTAVRQGHPDESYVRYHLGRALRHNGQFEEAVAQYQAAMRLTPDRPFAYSDLAWLKAVCPEAEIRDTAEAVRLAEQAVVLAQGRYPEALDSLAAAYAAAGRFEEALKQADAALLGARARRDDSLAKAIAARRELYRARQPYREYGAPVPAPERGP